MKRWWQLVVFSDKLYQIFLESYKSNNHFIRKIPWAVFFLKNMLTSRNKTNFMPLRAQEWGMTTPPVCLAYVINLICIHWVNCDYGTLFVTLELFSEQLGWVASYLSTTHLLLWFSVIKKRRSIFSRFPQSHYRCYVTVVHFFFLSLSFRWLIVTYGLTSLPFFLLQPQDQIVRLAASIRHLERLTGTSQWMGHGLQ